MASLPAGSKGKSITVEMFTREYMNSYKARETVIEMAERTGYSVHIIYSRPKRYFKEYGIKFPPLVSRSNPPVTPSEVKRLNKLIAKQSKA